MTRQMCVWILGAVAAGCVTEVPHEGPLQSSCELVVTPISMTEPGPQGVSGQDLLSDAQARFGRFTVEWNGTPGVSPATDEVSLSFGQPVAELRQAVNCIGATDEVWLEYLQVTVDADLQNADESLGASLELELIAPDFHTHGTHLRGAAPLQASGDYLEHLMQSNATGQMEVSFRSLAVEAFLDRGEVEGAPQHISLTRWFQTDTSSGSATTYGCAHDTVCITPSGP